jgi:geranylgeranyl diphosphate synthase type I
VMDQSATRRGVPSSHVHLTEAARERGCDDPERIGLAEAVLAGDVAAVLADQLLLEAGFPAERLVDALAVYHVVRSEMAAGQELDLVGSDRDAGKVAHLKGGSYTVRGPLLVGAALAGATPEVREALIGFGDPLGEAFQLLDDLRDGDAADGVTHVRAHELARVGVERLTTAPLPPDALAALAALAAAVADA